MVELMREHCLPASDAQVVALRAFLSHSTDEMAQLVYQLGDAGIAGYLRLADTALSLLARRRFPRYSNADVVRYVASVRRERLSEGDAYDINPAVAENVLRFSLGVPVPSQPPQERLQAVIALLDALSISELHTATDIDELLGEAHVRSQPRLARPGKT
jgi:hypothetical protein